MEGSFVSHAPRRNDGPASDFMGTLLSTRGWAVDDPAHEHIYRRLAGWEDTAGEAHSHCNKVGASPDARMTMRMANQPKPSKRDAYCPCRAERKRRPQDADLGIALDPQLHQKLDLGGNNMKDQRRRCGCGKQYVQPKGYWTMLRPASRFAWPGAADCSVNLLAGFSTTYWNQELRFAWGLLIHPPPHDRLCVAGASPERLHDTLVVYGGPLCSDIAKALGLAVAHSCSARYHRIPGHMEPPWWPQACHCDPQSAHMGSLLIPSHANGTSQGSEAIAPMTASLQPSDDDFAQCTSPLRASVACGMAVGRRKIENSDSKTRVDPCVCCDEKTCRHWSLSAHMTREPGMACTSYEPICLCDRRLISGELRWANHSSVPGLARGWYSWFRRGAKSPYVPSCSVRL